LITCVDLNYLGEEWLGREFDRKCVDDLKPLVGPWGKGIDATGEPGEYHTTVLDAPLFRQTIDIQKVTRRKKELDFGGYPNRVGNFFYWDVENAFLRQKG